ncbi:glycosyltransferase family 4 protein [Pareuzebyella sediminis]|uniref:glycosyltransferase family 4 protein n=1 Tax=Pareuzebyella sediminis TaxID=2607998 RepID=UPI0011EFACFD|nr:glycosyltransferase family 4 protein [Pareuzebyella sediminis]
MSKKILCILGSKHFYGKERSNIEVYNLLKNHASASLKVLMNAEASDELKRYLQDFDTIEVRFPDRNQKKFKYINYILRSLSLNLKLLYTILKFRPDFIFLNDERIFYDIALPVYFSSSKVVYRIGDQPAYPKLSNYQVNSWIWKNIVLKKTEKFVYISEFIKSTVEVTGRDSSNDIVIYNYPPSRQKSSDRLSEKMIDDQTISIGYLGQIIADKGVHLFIEAAVNVLKDKKKARFYLAGDLNYSKEFSEMLIKLVIENNLEDKIVFLGSIDNVKTFFEHIDILVTPSMKEEPLGNVIVEAKKYSTPSIIFRSGGMPELIEHGVNGYVCESSTSANIVKGILYYLEKPERIELHGINAKASIKDLKIDYANFKQKWLWVFKK